MAFSREGEEEFEVYPLPDDHLLTRACLLISVSPFTYTQEPLDPKSHSVSVVAADLIILPSCREGKILTVQSADRSRIFSGFQRKKKLLQGNAAIVLNARGLHKAHSRLSR